MIIPTPASSLESARPDKMRKHGAKLLGCAIAVVEGPLASRMRRGQGMILAEGFDIGRVQVSLLRGMPKGASVNAWIEKHGAATFKAA